MAKDTKRGTQKPQIEGQTLQWPKIPKGSLRNRKSNDRHHNGHNKKDKRTNNDPQNITQKPKDREK